MRAFPVLQSGFISLSPETVELPNPTEPSVRQAVIYRELKPPLMEYFYSRSISDLFSRWSANSQLIGDMDFREDILKYGLEAFGEKRFQVWLDYQLESKRMTALHAKFILETIEYVITGAPRRIENIQWVNLLEAGEIPKHVKVNVDEFLKLKTNINGRTPIPVTFADMFVAWTSNRAGFEDLLVCLYVIFGARTRQTSVTDLAA